MKTVEIRISLPGQFASELSDMRLWLDNLRCEPSRFTYDLQGSAAVILVDFKRPHEADLFARAFHGRVLTGPHPT